ncbi:PilT protein domain protein [Candidatus Vecturithrix granuli]|uniref:PilT protein domain protein n=1 Tax=Vecturithrix granuli TaxID=1499967 RepID=A0A081BZ64_VECG1|nr:PilT protein domain protein [Candidatus Vecturithrix granuli]
MNEPLCLIDTDVLSYILKRREPFYQRSRDYLARYERFTISCLTYYECLRGYKAVNAIRRLQVFHELLQITDVLYLEQSILEKSAEIYSVLKPKGELPGEFDLIIGATALTHNMSIVTNNILHYQTIQGYFPLHITDWKRPHDKDEPRNME